MMTYMRSVIIPREKGDYIVIIIRDGLTSSMYAYIFQYPNSSTKTTIPSLEYLQNRISDDCLFKPVFQTMYYYLTSDDVIALLGQPSSGVIPTKIARVGQDLTDYDEDYGDYSISEVHPDIWGYTYDIKGYRKWMSIFYDFFDASSVKL